VLDQAEQRIARWQHGTAQLGVIQALELPQHGIAVPVQTHLKAFLSSPV